MMSGLRPVHSVATITWTSEMSGTASSGVAVMAHAPHSVKTIVPVNTRTRFPVHQSMIFGITRSPRDDGELPLPDWLTLPADRDGHIPAAAHRYQTATAVHAATHGRERDLVLHRRHVHRRHRGHEQPH